MPEISPGSYFPSLLAEKPFGTNSVEQPVNLLFLVFNSIHSNARLSQLSNLFLMRLDVSVGNTIGSCIGLDGVKDLNPEVALLFDLLVPLLDQPPELPGPEASFYDDYVQLSFVVFVQLAFRYEQSINLSFLDTKSILFNVVPLPRNLLFMRLVVCVDQIDRALLLKSILDGFFYLMKPVILEAYYRAYCTCPLEPLPVSMLSISFFWSFLLFIVMLDYRNFNPSLLRLDAQVVNSTGRCVSMNNILAPFSAIDCVFSTMSY